jgi:hypothetical protein
MNSSKALPFDIVQYILGFSKTYYKENYKNRSGTFYKQIEESRKTTISKVYVPIKHRCHKERFTGHRTYFYERFLGGKYILYVQYNPPHVDSDIDDDDIEEPEPEQNIEYSYFTGFCRVYKYLNIGYGIHRIDEHYFDKSKLVYCNV